MHTQPTASPAVASPGTPGAGPLRQGLPEHQHQILSRLLGCSPQWAALVAALPNLAKRDAPVFLTGETGTGKDLVAEVLHALSPRATHPFIKVAVSPEAANADGTDDSLLFGAIARAGLGTVYITELSDVPLPQQHELITRLRDGSAAAVCTCRFLAATNADLDALRKHKRLLANLAKLLVPHRLHLPPLRDRQGDIRYLAEQFLQRSAAALEKDIQGFTPGAMATLLGSPFPGNVRELRNVVEYAVMVCQDHHIARAHLPPHFSV